MRRIHRIEGLLSLLLSLVSAFAIYAQPPSKLASDWDLEITVPPQPTTPNRITFSGGAAAGTFIDKNGHSGTWERTGNKVTWTYKSVSDLINVFTGELSADWTAMTGVHCPHATANRRAFIDRSPRQKSNRDSFGVRIFVIGNICPFF